MKPAILATAVALAVAGQTAPGQTPSAPPDAEIRRVLSARVDKFRPNVGIVVGVIEPKGRRIVTYGRLDENDPRVLSGDTLFEIGSITKIFTSLLLTDMVQRGEVALSDPVAKFLPPGVKIPERGGKQITLRDLATHTSGLPRDAPLKTLINSYTQYSPEQLYEFLSGVRLTHDIGSQWGYSSLGVGLLGHALALRASTDFDHLVATRITGPLGMNSTEITLTPYARTRLAVGHTVIGYPAPENELGHWAAMGGLKSTANDLLTMLSAFLGYSNTPLAPAMTSMLNVRTPVHDGQEQALGWQVGWPWRGPGRPETIVSHSGVTDGFSSFAGYNPKTRVGVVVLVNHRTIDPSEIGNYLLDQRFSLKREKDLTPPKQREGTAIDRQLLDRYAGRYRFPEGNATVTREGDHLVLKGDDEPWPDAFYAESNQDFFSKTQDLQINFQTDRQGRVSGFVFHIDGKTKRVKRVD